MDLLHSVAQHKHISKNSPRQAPQIAQHSIIISFRGYNPYLGSTIDGPAPASELRHCGPGAGGFFWRLVLFVLQAIITSAMPTQYAVAENIGTEAVIKVQARRVVEKLG